MARRERRGPAALRDDRRRGRVRPARGRRELAAGRWVGIHWPEAYGGRGASPVQVAIFNMEYARSRALQPINRVGINLAGPTLLAHGTDEQKQRWLPAILTADEIWCQLFSEPDAGSDLASLQTQAVRVDDGWLLSGQKVWTSYAQFARWGICLARTDADAPKHKGISYLVVDMQAPGIEVRPLVQITGDAEFNEVFFDEVFVPDDQLVGALHNGWAVANTTLAHERGTAFPFKEQVVHEVYLDELWQLAAARDVLDDVEIADALAQSFVELRVLRLHNWRTLSRLDEGHRARARVEHHEARVDRHDPGPLGPRARRRRRGRAAVVGRRRQSRAAASGSGSGCGRRRRRSRAARPRCSARSSASACSACRVSVASRVPQVQVIGLDHVVLRCADIEASLAFYCDELGLAPDRVDEWRRGETFFPSVRIDATTLIDLFPAPPGLRRDPTASGRNMEHFCLVIEPADLDALAAHFPGLATRRRPVRRAGLRIEPLRAGSRRQHRRAEELLVSKIATEVLLKERAAMCDTFEKFGADAPTLCEGWLTLDLAAHLVAREARSDAAIGLVVPFLAGHLQKVMDKYKAKGYDPLVGDAAHRPAVDAPHRSARDRQRQRELRAPRRHPPRHRRSAACRSTRRWMTSSGRCSASACSKKSLPGVALTLRTPDGREKAVTKDGAPVVMTGDPGELALYMSGRKDAAVVTLDGADDAVAVVQEREVRRRDRVAERRRGLASTAMKELVYHRHLLPAAEQHADKVAVIDGAYTATYAQHLDRVAAHASARSRSSASAAATASR